MRLQNFASTVVYDDSTNVSQFDYTLMEADDSPQPATFTDFDSQIPNHVHRSDFKAGNFFSPSLLFNVVETLVRRRVCAENEYSGVSLTG